MQKSYKVCVVIGFYSALFYHDVRHFELETIMIYNEVFMRKFEQCF